METYKQVVTLTFVGKPTGDNYLNIALDTDSASRNPQEYDSNGKAIYNPFQSGSPKTGRQYPSWGKVKLYWIDIDVDSNNDGVINSADDAIEDKADITGHLVTIDNGNSDNDVIPDYADGYKLDYPLAYDEAGNLSFSQMTLSIPKWLDFKRATLQFDYQVSAPDAVNTSDYGLPSGFLRIWRVDGNEKRSRLPGGDNGWFDSGKAYTLTQLGITASCNLWVEAVTHDTSDYWAPKEINVSLRPDGQTVAASDRLRVTAVYDKKGWQTLTDKEAGFDRRDWDPSLGFAANHNNLTAIYTFYESLYNLEPAKFQWMGLAKVAGGSVVYSLQTMQTAQLFVNSIDGDASYMDALVNFLDVPNSLDKLEVEWLTMANDIFSDAAWQHVAYHVGGIREIHRMVAANSIPKSPVDVAAAWDKIDSGVESQIWSGNLDLVNNEQNHTLAQGYQVIRGLKVIDPSNSAYQAIVDLGLDPLNGHGMSMGEALSIGSSLRPPFPGAQTFASWAGATPIGLVPWCNKDLTVDAQRWEWMQVIWSGWQALTPAQRNAIIADPLP